MPKNLDVDRSYAVIWRYLLRRIQAEAAKPGMSRNAVAKRIGVGASVLQRWLEGRDGGKNIGLKTVLKILKALGLDLSHLHRLSREEPQLPRIVFPEECIEALQQVTCVWANNASGMSNILSSLRYIDAWSPKSSGSA